MTPSQGRAPVIRKSSVMVRDGGKARELVVTLHPTFMTLRLLGKRTEETIDLEAAYFGAIKARVFKERMNRGKARKERADLSKLLRKARR